jgi:hypothetical protein
VDWVVLEIDNISEAGILSCRKLKVWQWLDMELMSFQLSSLQEVVTR